MASRFLKRLSEGPPIVADGGTGMVVTAAVPHLRCPEEANLRAPDSVVAVHVGFINAGAELIQTNTFGANRRKLAARYLDDELERINGAAVKLAREARQMSGREVFIGGSIGPLGERQAARGEVFAEQARVLEGRGVDLFMLETFYDLAELTAAIEGVHGVSSLPIVAMLSFDEEAVTLSGVTARDAAEHLKGLGVAAIGANHGAGLHAALAAIEQMAESGLPLVALPNLGLASLAGGRIVYPHASPEYFAEFAAHARRLGARVVGGCCGTTPAEIEAIASAVRDDRAPRARLEFAERTLVPSGAGEGGETELARMLRAGEFVVSVQLDPPLGGNNTGMIEVSRAIKESGRAHLVDVNDNATARVGMNALMSAAAIERRAGIETIPHLTPRDTSIMGLQAALLGAHADGVRNVLAVTGDPPEVGDYPGSHGVYEVDSIGLSQIISGLNRGEDFNGRAIDAPTSFFLGVAVNPTADDLALEVERFHQKIDAGASFAMTQILFDFAQLDRLEEALGGPSPIPLLVGLWPLRSHQLAVRLHNEVPGIEVPEAVRQALLDAGPSAPGVGMRIAGELLVQARERVAGVYVVAPFRQPLAVLEMLA